MATKPKAHMSTSMDPDTTQTTKTGIVRDEGDLAAWLARG